MPLLIRVEDFEGNVIAQYDDQKGVLNPILNYCYEHPFKINIFKYVDLYDDTILNGLQIKDLLIDIDFLKENLQLMDNEKIEVFSLLIALCKRALKEPHLFLKFYGD